MQQKLNRLRKLLRKLDQRRPLSSMRTSVLQSVAELTPVTVKQLAERHQVRMPTMSKLLDELQQHGLVLRAHAKEDARQRLIILTQKGRAQLAHSQQMEADFWRDIEDQLGEQDWQSLQTSLTKLTAILQSLDAIESETVSG